MFNNVALDVVIGLVFIYLLYSLFATVLSEIIATKLGLRARNLKEGVDRMLNDDKDDKGFWARFWDSLKLTKNPKNPRITNFYNHPEIKYLGSTGIFKIPSQFKAVSFSKTLLNLLNETGYKKLLVDNNAKMDDPKEGDIKDIPVTEISKDRIVAALEGIINEHKTATTSEEKEKIVIDEETAKYVLSIWKESYGDLVKFKLQLEAWFDRTMEQCTEWYKRKIQMVLLAIGFLLAWFFNADTFTIISKLSTDKDARDKIVTLAAAYNEDHNRPAEATFGIPPVTPNPSKESRPSDTNLAKPKTEADSLKDLLRKSEENYNRAWTSKLDSLNNVKKKLEKEIVDANTILGLGGWAPDSVKVSFDSITHERIYTPQIDYVSLSSCDQKVTDGYIYFSHGDKWLYFLSLLCHHFFGFLITAIAISLGAPFWFDLLNKLMQLRTSLKQETDSTNTLGNGMVSPLNREA